MNILLITILAALGAALLYIEGYQRGRSGK